MNPLNRRSWIRSVLATLASFPVLGKLVPKPRPKTVLTFGQVPHLPLVDGHRYRYLRSLDVTVTQCYLQDMDTGQWEILSLGCPEEME